MNRMNAGLLLSAVTGCILTPHAAACTMNPPTPPPTFWIGPVVNNGDDTATLTVGQKISIFPPLTITQCACGIGLGSTGQPLPGGVSVSRVRIVSVGPNDEIISELGEFAPLLMNSNTSAGLAGGSGATPGATWFGFTGQIAPFDPMLPPGATMFKMLFDIVLPKIILPNFSIPGQLAGGTADPNGFPDFSGPHATTYFAPVNDRIVPAPGAVALALVACAAAGSHRRR